MGRTGGWMEGEMVEEARSYAWSRKAADSERIYCNTVWRHSYSVRGSQTIRYGSLGVIYILDPKRHWINLRPYLLFCLKII